jgi:drug/metabolite transporter (DMT)-like permease
MLGLGGTVVSYDTAARRLYMDRTVGKSYHVEDESRPSGLGRTRALIDALARVSGPLQVLGWNVVFASAYIVYAAFVSTLDPVAALAWMPIFAAAAAYAAARRSPGCLKLRRVNRAVLAAQTASSAISFLILFALLSRESAVPVLALLLITPAVTVIAAALVFGDRAKSWSWWTAGFALCFTGTAVFRFSGRPLETAAASTLALAAGYVVLSVCSSITRSALTRAGASAVGVTLVGYVVTTVLAFALALAIGRVALPSPAQLVALVYLGTVPTAAGAIGYQRALNKVGYPTAEAIGMSKPFLGYLFALAIALTGTASPPQILTAAEYTDLCVAVIGACVCVTLGRSVGPTESITTGVINSRGVDKEEVSP